jgi:hypothetical protein
MRFYGYTGFFVSAAATGATCLRVFRVIQGMWIHQPPGPGNFTGFSGYTGYTRDDAPSAYARSALYFFGGDPMWKSARVLSISRVVFAAPLCSLRAPCCRLAAAMVGCAALPRTGTRAGKWRAESGSGGSARWEQADGCLHELDLMHGVPCNP